MRLLPLTILLSLLLNNAMAQPSGKELLITPLTGNFYIYTTYHVYQGERYPANGMYLITSKGAVLFDSPWDTTQFQPLLDSIRSRHHTNVVLCIATHFHEDRTGGLEYYRLKGIRTYTSRQTDELSKAKGKKRAEYLIDKDSTFRIGEYSFQTYYPGKGHAPDNIVIWFEKEKILYGGCLIKSTDDETLGNMSDASVKDYETTLVNVQRHCPQPRYIIPGHNSWVNPGSLKHSLHMAKELKKKTAAHQ